MLIWLIAVAVLVLIWGGLWKSNLKLAFGVLIGLLIGWVLSRLMASYFIGMHEMPLWLPPLPLALVAIALFVTGVVVWFKAPPPGPSDHS